MVSTAPSSFNVAGCPMSNADINRELAADRDWRTAYPYVEAQARTVLDGLSHWVSTAALVALLYSPSEAQDDKVRNRIFKALRAASTRGLQRYVTLGEPEKVGTVQNARRAHWHAGRAEVNPPVKSCCPACGRPL